MGFRLGFGNLPEGLVNENDDSLCEHPKTSSCWMGSGMQILKLMVWGSGFGAYVGFSGAS